MSEPVHSKDPRLNREISRWAAPRATGDDLELLFFGAALLGAVVILLSL